MFYPFVLNPVSCGKLLLSVHTRNRADIGVNGDRFSQKQVVFTETEFCTIAAYRYYIYYSTLSCIDVKKYSLFF